MKYKSRLGHGLAFQPKKDMELFRKMARKGYHLCGFSGTLCYKFEQGEPKDYIFSYTAKSNPDEDYIAFFTDTGWEPVILIPNLQVFRALPGTEPIYTDPETLVDFYKEQLQSYFKYAIFSAGFFIVCYFLSLKLSNPLGPIIFLIGLIPFVFTVMPFGGFLFHYIKYKNQHNYN